MQLSDELADAVRCFCNATPAVSKAWIFGSRAKGTAREHSDVDVALLLEPRYWDADTEWILRADDWRKDLQSRIGDTPRVDLHNASPNEDEIVWQAVKADGKLVYQVDHGTRADA